MFKKMYVYTVMYILVDTVYYVQDIIQMGRCDVHGKIVSLVQAICISVWIHSHISSPGLLIQCAQLLWPT